MATPKPLGTPQAIGRRFHLVSYVPTTVFVFSAWYSATLSTKGFDASAADIRAVGLPPVAAALGLSVALSLVLHPLQFAMVQTLEGYWHAGPLRRLGVRLLRRRLAKVERWQRQLRVDDLPAHRDRIRAALYVGGAAQDSAARYRDGELHLDNPHIARFLGERDDAQAEAAAASYLAWSPLRRLDAVPSGHRALPTELGSTLRKYEETAGRPYGLDAVTAVPRMIHAMPETLRAEHNDHRSQLDLAVRFCWTFMALAVLNLLLAGNSLATGNLERAVALGTIAGVTGALARLSYHGAVQAAHGYGTALCTIMDLARWDVVAALRQPLPGTQEDEAVGNARVMQILRDRRQPASGGGLAYEHPAPDPISV